MRDFQVGGRVFNEARPLVIAEVGTGHRGDLVKASELIRAAVGAGADCVKFQHVYADEIIHPATGLVPLPGGPTPLYDVFRSLETGPDFLAALKERTEEAGAVFLCTPFGPRSARELRSLGVEAMKLASPELNHVELLDELASYGLPTIVSSGVSRLADIEFALARLSARDPGDAPASEPDGASPSRGGLALLHCVTAYPAPEADYNLSMLPSLASLFGLPVGVSDHSMDPCLVPRLAVASCAAIVEKHICLSRLDDGLDDRIALQPEDFAAMCAGVRATARTLSEGGAKAALADLEDAYGPERVRAALGDGVKRLAPSEEANYGRTNRSLHALRPIRAGERFSAGNVAALRTEKVLSPGLEPRYLPLVLGRMAARDVSDGAGLSWDDLGTPAG